jgi:hypothetical protein
MVNMAWYSLIKKAIEWKALNIGKWRKPKKDKHKLGSWIVKYHIIWKNIDILTCDEKWHFLHTISITIYIVFLLYFCYIFKQT